MTRPTARIPLDLIETSQKMIDAAAAVTTGRLHLSSPTETRFMLVENDPLAVSYFRYELGRQIASALLMMDPNVIAVYEDHDLCSHEDVSLEDPLRLFVQVTYRTFALTTVIAALNQALGQAFLDLLPEAPEALIEAVIIDDRDSRLLQIGVSGFRPSPVLLAGRN